MKTLTGMIGPKGRPGYLVPHAHGVINLMDPPRKFLVDPAAARVIDEEDKDLVLTLAVYEQIRDAIRDGAPMFVEPIAGEEDERLREAVEEIERRGRRIEELEGDLRNAEARAVDLEQRNRSGRQMHDELLARFDAATARVTELEQQLAAAALAPVPASASPPAAAPEAAVPAAKSSTKPPRG